MRTLLAAAALALGLLASPSQAMTAQEFWTQEFSKTAPKAQRSAQVQRTRRAAEIPAASLSLGFGGSWLAANLGASRPRGAPGPWCGYAMRLEVMSMGRPDPGPAYNAVRSWHGYGSPAPRGAIGSLFISAGHISKVVAHDCPAGFVRTISGNATGARVALMCESLSRLRVSRWP
jgi:hypothetical protein